MSKCNIYARITTRTLVDAARYCSGNREYVDDRIMRAIERMMQRKLDTATPIDMVAAADLLNVVNEVLK